MKNNVVMMDYDGFEKMLVSEFGWEHGIGMATYHEDGVSAYWDYRTEGEVRSSNYDVELAWEEVAERFGYDHCEWCADESGNDCVLCWND